MKKVVSQPNSIRPSRSNERERLLYVEDDDENWHVAELRLGEDFELLRAANARDACRVLKESGSGLIAILMDIELRGSELNGIELTELFRGKRQTRMLPEFARNLPTFTNPIIFVTAHGARYSDVELMLFGADRVIQKPVNFNALSLALQSIQFAHHGAKKR
ncbi:MAG TPA: response regulator [Polyangiales bacterium]|nr:response regulator [Polyangiales bacterium]